MSKPTVIVLGGYGVFGSLITASLARHSEIHVLTAGRSLQAAENLCRSLGTPSVQPLALDCSAPDFAAKLAEQRPAVVIDAVGPFQGRDYTVGRACIEMGAHCVDLADGREYVAGVTALDAAARTRNVLVTSGASSCPAISTAVMDRFAAQFDEISSASLGITPGQKAPRGLGTTRAVLGYCGRPIAAFRNGQMTQVPGWSGLTRQTYPTPVGSRWLSYIDVPETSVWPARYPTLRTIQLHAGLESSVLHLSLSALSRLVHAGLIRTLQPYARPMLQAAKLFEPFGHPVGAMHVTATGRARGRKLSRTWFIIAERGSGPQIPAAPAATIAKKLLGVPGYAPVTARGAMPCIGLLQLDEVLNELRRFAIRTEVRETLLE